MSALAAVLSRRGAPPPNEIAATLTRVLRPFAHDGVVTYADTLVTMAAGLVHVTPEDQTIRQPVTGGDGRFVVLFDGRIDYRDDLVRRLGISSPDLSMLSDAVLAAKAFERWGTDLGLMVDGDFALIVWDRSEQRLHAIRDRLGLCELSYHATSDQIIVSTLPAVFFALGVERKADLDILARHLAGHGASDARRNLYVGIDRLPPAHTLTADRGGVHVSRYWRLDPAPAYINFARDSDYVEAAGEVFTAAVATRMRTTGRVGSDLTGGLDSATVAVTALGLLPSGTLPTFTHVPEAGWNGPVTKGRYPDETPFVREIAAMHPRLDPSFIENRAPAWDSVLDDYFRVAQSIWLFPRYLQVFSDTFSAARAKGVTALLNGGTGNLSLTWHGPGVFGGWLAEGRYGKIVEELRLISPTPTAFLRGMVSRVLVPAGPDWVWNAYARAKYGTAEQRDFSAYGFLNPDRFTEMTLPEQNYQPRPAIDSRPSRVAWLVPDDDHNATDFHAWARAVHRIDYRDPFRDRRLVEWCLRVPEEQYHGRGEPRWLVKRMMKGRLPPSVLYNRLRGASEGDWHHQMTRQLPLMREQLDAMAEDGDVASLLDISRMQKAMADWPAETPIEPADPRIYTLPAALPYAMAVGRFIRWTKGANL